MRLTSKSMIRRARGSAGRNHHQQRDGIATVEAAITIPIFIFLILATLDCCTCLFLRQSLTVAAYEGARVAIVPNAQSSNVQAQINATLEERGIFQSTSTITPSDLVSLPEGSIVTVTISATPSSNVPIFSGLFNQTELTGSVSLMVEN